MISKLINKILGNNVILNNTIYKIKTSLSKRENEISLYNVVTGGYVRHKFGNIIETKLDDAIDKYFIDDSSFLVEFFDDSSVLLRCSNLNNVYLSTKTEEPNGELVVSENLKRLPVKIYNSLDKSEHLFICDECVDVVAGNIGSEGTYSFKIHEEKNVSVKKGLFKKKESYLKFSDNKLSFDTRKDKDIDFDSESSFYLGVSGSDLSLVCVSSLSKNADLEPQRIKYEFQSLLINEKLNVDLDSLILDLSEIYNDFRFESLIKVLDAQTKLINQFDKKLGSLQSKLDSLQKAKEPKSECKFVSYESNFTKLQKGYESCFSQLQKKVDTLEKRIMSDVYNKMSLLTNLVSRQVSDCLVSIVVPVYNVEKYLEETLNSIINQNYVSWELICVDDCSTDNSLGILNEFSRIDRRIKVIASSENHGAGYARNIGIIEANGSYLAILDADDIYSQNFLKNLVYSALNTDADVTVCRTNKLIEATGTIENIPWTIKEPLLPKSKIFRPFNFSKYVFQSFVGWSWDKLFKKDFIDRSGLKFQEIRSTNDAYFVYLSLCFAQTISIVPDILVTHRYHNSSLASTRREDPTCFSQAIHAIFETLKKTPDSDRYMQSFFNWAIEISFWHYKTIDEELKPVILNEFKKIASSMQIFNGLEEIYDEVSLRWIIDNDVELMDKPLVSIVVPLYNQEKYLKECMDSLVNQTLKNIEIIVVNDGSTDSSLSIAEEYQKGDDRIKIIDKTNSGYGNTMNLGIDAATGEYIGIVEPDDFIDLSMYEELYIKAKSKNLDLIKSDFYRFVTDEKGEYVLDYIQIDKAKKFYNKILNPEENLDVFRLVMNTWSGIYKTDFIRNNNIRHNETPGASFQDNGFWFQTFIKANRVFFLDKAFYKNRRDNENSSVKSKGKVYCFTEEYKYIYDLIEKIDPTKRDMFLKPYFLKLFHNYNFNLCRIDPSFREQFISYISNQFKEFRDAGVLRTDMFSSNERDKLEKLVNEPNDYLQNELYK